MEGIYLEKLNRSALFLNFGISNKEYKIVLITKED